MKRAVPWIRVAGFIVGLVVLVAIFDYAFAQTGYVRYVLTYFQNSDEDIDTLVLGASHARSAIDPQKIDDVNDTNSFSLAIPGEMVKDSYYVLQEACRSKKIKTLIFDVDYQYWMEPQAEGYFQEPFIYNQLSWSSPVKWKYMAENMLNLDVRNAFTKRNVYLCTPSSVKTNISQKRSQEYKDADIYSIEVPDANGPYIGKGFFYREVSGLQPGGDAYVDGWVGRENDGLSEVAVTKFKQIKKFCDDNGIELICVTSPITPSVMKKLGMGTSSNSMMSSMMNTNVFYSLPSHASLYDDQYDVKAGHWPKNKNECVLVLSKKGGISDFMLYTLGLRDPAQLDQMLKAFSEEKSVKVTTGKQGYRYKDLLGITFKVVNASSYYQYDDTYKVYKDKSNDTNYINSLVQNGSDLKIVGVVQPKESTNASMLAMGIYYPYSLATSTIKDASNSQIVKEQLENKNINVITGQSFNDPSQKSFDLSSMFQVDNNALKNAFQFDTSKVNMSMPHMDLSQVLSQIKIDISDTDASAFMSTLTSGYNDYLKEHPLKEAENLNEVVQNYLQSQRASDIIKKGIDDAIKENGEIKITEEQMQKIMKNVADDFSDYAKEDINSFTLGLQSSMMNYLNSQDSKQVINQFINKVIKDNHLDAQLNTIMSGYMQTVTKQMSTSLSQAFTFNPDVFKQAIKMNRDGADMTELLKSMMNTEQSSYDNNMKKFGYCSFDDPSSISIYPQDFEKKQSVLDYLDHYNEKMKKIDEDKVITYTDVVGTLMSSVTDIVDVISYVLIAFVGISLVVSSIMIGVITYISVLERKKEIGILRAIGASKHNISQVFNAETFIVGLLSGLMGIGITLILLIPTNIIIHNVSNQASINAMLPVSGAIILILLSIGLTLLGGLIPSRKAAKEDPVKALRTD